MADRREALKIIGAVGASCAFPFSADELYGQHAGHAKPAAEAAPEAPKFFQASDYETISRLADLIIPETDTPGAVAAGVPAYIDLVVSRNREHQAVFRKGLRWLEREAGRLAGKRFVELAEEQQIGLLTPLADADAGSRKAGDAFFRAMKAMTADGYYTSRAGLVEELGFQGGAVLAEFPSCVHEH